MKHLTLLFLSLISICSYGQGFYESEITRSHTHYEFDGQKFKYPDLLENGKEYTFSNKLEMRRDSIYDIELKVKRSGPFLDYTLNMYYKSKLMETRSDTVIVNVPWLAVRELGGEDDELVACYMLADGDRRYKGAFCDLNFHKEKDNEGRRLISIFYGENNDDSGLYLGFYHQLD